MCVEKFECAVIVDGKSYRIELETILLKNHSFLYVDSSF